MNIIKRLVMPLALLICSGTASAQTLPQYDNSVHLGVASCATSSCHGRTAAKKHDGLPQNEYRRWAYHDVHAKSYNTLLTKEAKRIAAKLRIGSPETEDLCLDCHVDNPTANFQGKRFSHEDGVGCESCHGGAENWLASHTAKESTHDENIANGMYPTDDPNARTKLCVSCHLGDDKKFASHRIMGAGHPRLRFEMSAYSTNMVPHFETNEWDVQQGKKTPDDIALWIHGLLGSADNMLNMWQAHVGQKQWTSELAMFDCHSCHHAMDDLQWEPSAYRKDKEPGQLRINTSLIEILASISKGLKWDESDRLIGSLVQLHNNKQWQQGNNTAVNELSAVLQRLRQHVEAQPFTDVDMKNIRQQLVRDARNGNFNSFMLAEQFYLSFETLAIALGDVEQYRTSIDKIYKTLASESEYKPHKFQAQAKALRLK